MSGNSTAVPHAARTTGESPVATAVGSPAPSTRRPLVRAAYDALPPGGAVVAIENVIDDARRTNAFGLMMSLNMLIEFGDAFDFTGADFHAWCREAGFRSYEVVHLNGPCSAAIACK